MQITAGIITNQGIKTPNQIQAALPYVQMSDLKALKKAISSPMPMATKKAPARK